MHRRGDQGWPRVRPIDFGFSRFRQNKETVDREPPLADRIRWADQGRGIAIEEGWSIVGSSEGLRGPRRQRYLHVLWRAKRAREQREPHDPGPFQDPSDVHRVSPVQYVRVGSGETLGDGSKDRRLGEISAPPPRPCSPGPVESSCCSRLGQGLGRWRPSSRDGWRDDERGLRMIGRWNRAGRAVWSWHWWVAVGSREAQERSVSPLQRTRIRATSGVARSQALLTPP